MQDIVHGRPVRIEDHYECPECGLVLPDAAVTASNGTKLVDIAGQHVGFYPYGPSDIRTALSCTHPSVKRIENLNNTEIVLENEVPAEKGDTVKEAKQPDQFTQRLNRDGMHSFWQMRELVRQGM